ncbi:hypothetical protein D8674_024591 [Pyrus ussuriensis x Pyrus communis]|uniref:Nodulin-like domain-containing protein n=1 Tax=Pyrus ussuriensis x Pyrus communis TaxID=2448454 RepID=A0A5N5H3B7_9ROSA|nr:hypothetical protein D8674_024591 [Pyrus ussuriensis x Pyrus communis]
MLILFMAISCGVGGTLTHKHFHIFGEQFPCPLILTLMLLLSCVGHLLIALGVPNSLYFASYYATLTNVGGVVSPIGAYLLNVKVARNLYDVKALKQMKALGRTRKPWEGLSCVGVQCYKLAFIIMTTVAFFRSLVSFN